jgi:ABC-type lipoprotein release transport system permease subunit
MLLIATALLATVLPARRATRIAPTEALRED